MESERITEQPSPHRHLESLSVADLLTKINREDALVAGAVQAAIPQIIQLVDVITDRLLAGGRLFYLGAGTSGRLGVLDASECPPTFGVPEQLVTGIIAGGEQALRKAVEYAEDDINTGWRDLESHQVNTSDVVVGISASGDTPYVKAALQACTEKKIITGSICCNPNSPISAVANFPVEVVVGPEFLTGSTRMKSGTAQKLVLNMISTTVMIQLGMVEDNRMVNMQLTNNKLVDRGVKILMNACNITDYEQARQMLLQSGSVKKAIENYHL